MGFCECEYNITESIKATKFLRRLGYTNAQTQKILDKKRLYQHGKIIKKGDILQVGHVVLIEFIPKDLGLKPIFSDSFHLDSIN
ncbi:hypothetical protein DCO58_03200 [Helicobacter saguini]|uniref:RNA-binding S4 domain-containing protein n=1 Tax=Helicobacter saguini TaxID=1548018 RepID=A0A347VS76_9HELI|nr:hypothetical protein [Helicobacter saguini]MWV62623.1 hypothetical protein [Helicobacter saguini]MWV66705.1 hypothetical protein [Helicobacter saguini]MWV69055.1 hypothetical protein [Helicobacter saguini]MWV71391.1 hypothetical protein [Helicobacter saguini]TLD94021.1 hypothetical protein LS64_007645 [Helicobacter saguini]